MLKVNLEKYCDETGISHHGMNRHELIQEIYKHELDVINNSIKTGTSSTLLRERIRALAKIYANNLNDKITTRKKEMQKDDNSHYLIYQLLGVSGEEGTLIDEYQNTGRFLYKYTGSFLEEAASMCLFFHNRQGGKSKVENTFGRKPKTFEIDFLNGNEAIELKWRDATTDGDHIVKEHTRVEVIKSHGYKPVRVMFYDPQRNQAKKIQQKLKHLYKSHNGEYHAGNEAWDYVRDITGYNFYNIIEELSFGAWGNKSMLNNIK